MKTSYQYYVLGCHDAGLLPVSAWRFNIAYGKYLQDRGNEMQDILSRSLQQRPRILARWQRLQFLADLVRRGQDIADRVRRYGSDDEEPGAAGAGVREPLPPRVPVLAGYAARPLPTDDPLKGSDWWRV